MFNDIKKGFGLGIGYLIAVELFDLIEKKIKARKEENDNL